jgi:hypothetical protein
MFSKVLVFTFLFASAFSANAAIIASIQLQQPTGTVLDTESFDIWGTLTLDPLSDPLVYDPSAPFPHSLDASLVPTVGSFDGNDNIPFVTYDSINLYIRYSCPTNSADCMQYVGYDLDHVEGPLHWGSFGSGGFMMTPGESQELYFATMAPIYGVLPGTYSWAAISVGFRFSGTDIDGNTLRSSVELASSCPSRTPDCAFTRTVISAVPVPAAAWLFGSALLGLVGLKRKIKNY